MKITPVKGTNDYLPNEVEIRDYLQNEILKVYVANGFEHITTPIIEDIENLDKSDGGENLNLIFKIMKRGDKLEKAVSSLQENPKTGTACENEIADMGLRYDLTLPLSRYFANNKDKLTLPMKCIQMDRVYRAERPQKGRLREFVQCDIDIIGSDSTDSEVELILTTTKALKAIGMKNFKVKINDRRLLRSFLQNCGFTEDQLDSVCITFDKMDKVGLDGVKAELTDKGFDAAAIEKFIGFFGSVSSAQEISLESVEAILDDKAPAESVRGIINTVNDNLEATAQAVFQEQFASFYGADELPDGYRIINLDNLCTVKGGKRLPADCKLLDTPTDHPYIRVRDVGSNRYVCLTNQFQYIDEETYSAISRYIVNTGDIVISIVGTIGLLGKIHSSLDKANLTENCVKLANIHTVTSDYLYYTLCYKKQIKEIDLLTVGAVQAKLPMYNIQSMKILVPPTKAIEAFQRKMNVLNEQIEANTVEIQKLYELEEVLLAKLSD